MSNLLGVMPLPYRLFHRSKLILVVASDYYDVLPFLGNNRHHVLHGSKHWNDCNCPQVGHVLIMIYRHIF